MSKKSTPALWANSVFELRDAYRAFRQAISEHPDRANLVRRYEELLYKFQQEWATELPQEDLPQEDGK